MGVDAQVLYAAPRLAAWLAKVFTVMGGFMAGTGVLIAYLGWKVMPLRTRVMTAALALTGALTLVLMSAVNFALQSDFRWFLALPRAGLSICRASIPSSGRPLDGQGCPKIRGCKPFIFQRRAATSE